MGYTHYWELYAQRLPEAALVVIRDILQEAYASRLVQFEHDTKQPPLVTPTLIRFNGVGEAGHETFFFSTEDDFVTSEGRPFACCKTAQKPYDDVVMKVLIVLKHYLGQKLTVRSHGDFNEEWSTVREEMQEQYNIFTYEHAELITDRQAA